MAQSTVRTLEVPAVIATDSEAATVPDVPRRLNQRTTDDVLSLVGSIVGSLAFVWLVYYQILPLNGLLGFIVCWYFAFLAMFAGVTALSHPRPVVISRLVGAVVTLAAALVAFALVTVVVYTVFTGRAALTHLNFFTQDASRAGPTTRLGQGGIRNVIVGSLIQVGLAVVISVPLGLGTAVFLTELGGGFSKVVRTVVEAMTAIPDLLAGLFVYVTLVYGLHWNKDGLAVAVALSVTMTPIIARSAEVALRVVPGGLREASLALGASHWRTVGRIVLPTARPGLATALILAIARGIGESAPLLIVSGASGFWNANPVSEPMNSLPLYTYANVRSGQHLSIVRAFGAATVLLMIVLVLFAAARFLARQRTAQR